jgi:prevent-host-death family protein
MEVTIRQAKAHFERLLERVKHGEEVIIKRAAAAVARLLPWRAQTFGDWTSLGEKSG